MAAVSIGSPQGLSLNGLQFLIGLIFISGVDEDMPGFLPAEGGLYSPADYPEVFAKYGNRYGGDGINTFAMPNLQGVVVRGMDRNRGIDPGRLIGSEQLDAMQGHWHGMQIGADIPGAPAGGSDAYGNSGDGGSAIPNSVKQTYYSDGVNGVPRIAGETRMRNVAMPFFVFVGR